MRRRLRKRIGQALERAVGALRRDVQGAAAMEFAVAAPVMAVALAGALELALAGFVGSLLESSLSDASRFGITGFTTEGVTREQRVRDIVATRTLGCLVPECGGIDYTYRSSREALWDRYYTAAPRRRTPSERQYSDRRLRSKS